MLFRSDVSLAVVDAKVGAGEVFIENQEFGDQFL
jgi:hypothetical protein